MSMVFKDQHNYLNPGACPIAEKEHIKDLGVMISSDLSFSHHINKVVQSCYKLTGWVLRSFKGRSRPLMMTLWNTMVQSRLDYCSQLWSPNTAGNINLLEDVQRSYTRKIDGMRGLDYWERLQTLRMYSQEQRRERYAIIYIWKVANKLVDGYSLSFTNGRQGRQCKVGSVNHSAPASVRGAREASIPVKGAKLFNLLPKELRDLSSSKVERFKAKLDRYLSSIPDEPKVPERKRLAETNSLQHQVPLSRVQHGGNEARQPVN